MEEMTTTCEGCPATEARLYTAKPANGSPSFKVRYCGDCAASYQGADMGASGCEAQGALTLMEYRLGDVVRDCYGKTHEVVGAHGCSVAMYDGETFHPTKIALVCAANGAAS